MAKYTSANERDPPPTILEEHAAALSAAPLLNLRVWTRWRLLLQERTPAAPRTVI